MVHFRVSYMSDAQVPYTKFGFILKKRFALSDALSIFLEKIYLPNYEQKKTMHFYANYGTVC